VGTKTLTPRWVRAYGDMQAVSAFGRFYELNSESAPILVLDRATVLPKDADYIEVRS